MGRALRALSVEMGCAMSDEQFERDDMTVVRGTNKIGGNFQVIYTGFADDGADDIVTRILDDRKSKGVQTFARGAPVKFAGDYSVTVDIIKPETSTGATVKAFKTDLSTLTTAPACSALMVKAGAAVHGIIVVIDGARLEKRDDSDHHSLSQEHEDQFVSGIEMLAKHTPCEGTALLILVINTESIRDGEMSDAEFREYCSQVENEVQLNFVFVEHTVLCTKAHVCCDDSLDEINVGLQLLEYQMSKPATTQS